MTFNDFKKQSGKSFSKISEETGIPKATLWRISQGKEIKLKHAFLLVDWSNGVIDLSDFQKSAEEAAV